MQPLEFFVTGTPKPAGSKKAFAIRKGGVLTGRVAVTDDSGKPGKLWRQCVTQTGCAAVAQHCTTPAERADFPLDGALMLGLTFFLQRPMAHHVAGKRERPLRPNAPPLPTGMPDATKLTRAVEDALTKVLWLDDAQIVQQSIAKCYCTDEYPDPGVLVWVSRF